MNFFKTSVIFSASVIATLAMAGNIDDIMSISVEENPNGAQGEQVTIQSKVDALTINKISGNRGNCRVMSVKGAIKDLYSSLGANAMGGQMSDLLAGNQKDLGSTLKFGEKQIFITEAGCSLLELDINSSSGNFNIKVGQ